MPIIKRDLEESRPLLNSLSSKSVGLAWLVLSIAGLVTAWCTLDSWNHDMSSDLFRTSEIRNTITNPFTGELKTVMDPFDYTFTLAFLQFAFMGLVFSIVFLARALMSGESIPQHLEHLSLTISDRRWPALVVTHVFGSFLLQSLMMPSQMMSLPLFASTRAVEIPVAAGGRAMLFGDKGHSAKTIMLMSAAAWMLFYSYTQIAECMCVWSGFGVVLTGLPLFLVYGLLLTLPAANVVLQESVLVNLQMNPMLMSSVQNLAATVLFLPILVFVHLFRYENVWNAAGMIFGHPEISMTVLWLCVQTTIMSMVTCGLIMTIDSFWTVAARSLRVVLWWSRQLLVFYMTSTTLLSVSRPHASMWSSVMLSGLVLGVAAVVTDIRSNDDADQKSALITRDVSMGKYI
jgi:hypothetical protein